MAGLIERRNAAEEERSDETQNGGEASTPDVTVSPTPEAFMTREARHRKSELCRFWLAVTDAIALLLGLIGAFYFRFELIPYIAPDFPTSDIPFSVYLPRILFGATLAIVFLIAFRAYEAHTLLRYRRSFPRITKALLVWLLAYPFISLVFGFDENLSRIYVATSFICVLTTLLGSRFLMQRLLSVMGLTAAFRQRILFVDWTGTTSKLSDITAKDRWHPYEVVGCAPAPGDRFTNQPPSNIETLGSYKEVATFCERGLVDIVILADGRRREGDVLSLARECEKNMVNFMVIPSGFQILLSGLELTTISSVPLLGVTSLPLDNPLNAALKRAIDIVGAIVGMIVSFPLIVIFGLMVYLESPGPIFYRQIRVGRKGRHFSIIKIRSMKLDAEKESGARWASEHDDRRLRVGTFMRRWNVDELPQFWNVLTGNLSLVGPRPERPELIKHFRETIPFYNARHNIIPGMTGWAQINGYRGDTDLSERIRYDLYYIENWNVILDFQIMLMTFFRWKGAH